MAADLLMKPGHLLAGVAGMHQFDTHHEAHRIEGQAGRCCLEKTLASDLKIAGRHLPELDNHFLKIF